jgi:hypothetical protein
VLHLDGRFQNEWLDHREDLTLADGFDDERDFDRDTDTRGELYEYGFGATFSPWARLSLDVGVRHRDRILDYDHLVDENLAAPPFDLTNGYPAFIRARNVDTDEIEARLVWRAIDWLKLTLRYQYSQSEYDTTTDPALVFVSINPEPVFYPGGRIRAGEEKAHTGSATLVLSPWRRVHLSTTVSYTDSRLDTGVVDGLILAPYEGTIVSVLTSGNVIVSEADDLRLLYSFSRGDYEQANAPEGLPLGIIYERHGLSAGWFHQWNDRVQTSIQYGYFQYEEPYVAGANDYTAHALMMGVSLRFE